MGASGSAYLVWALLAITFLVYLLAHLWNYDRFKCLRWGANSSPGAFRRVMTFTYLITVPLLVIFAVTMTSLKFTEGFVSASSGGPGALGRQDAMVIPRPVAMWQPLTRHWLLFASFVLSVAWGFEVSSHLEELTFWLFLLNQGSRPRAWFDSWEFRVYYTGSTIALLGLPLTATVTRHELETCIPYVIFVGSIVSTVTTVAFLYVLRKFPIFIRHVKTGGADGDVLMRLSMFYRLHKIRVVLRFLFTAPLLILTIDGIYGAGKIAGSLFWCDLLFIVGGIGSFSSSALTLQIFFPRATPEEQLDILVTTDKPGEAPKTPVPVGHISIGTHYRHTRRPETSVCTTPDYDDPSFSPMAMEPPNSAYMRDVPPTLDIIPPYTDASLAYHRTMSMLPTTRRGSMSASHLHPYIMNFRSPIDLCDSTDSNLGDPGHITLV